MKKFLLLAAVLFGMAVAVSAQEGYKFTDKKVIKNGRYGAYIAYKGKNYRLPHNRKAETITYEECLKVVNTAKKK